MLWAKEDVANGVRPSMDAYGHLLRRPHMAARLGLTRRSGEPVLFNDHLTSSLAPPAPRARDPVRHPRGARRLLAGGLLMWLLLEIAAPIVAAFAGFVLADSVDVHLAVEKLRRRHGWVVGAVEGLPGYRLEAWPHRFTRSRR